MPKTKGPALLEAGSALQVVLVAGPACGNLGLELYFEVHKCADFKRAKHLLEGDRPGILVLDLAHLSVSGEAQLHKLAARLSHIRVLALAESEDDALYEQFLRLGFVGLLTRDKPPATLVKAIRAVANGELWFPRRTLSSVLRGFLSSKDNELTPREREILALIGSGLKNQQIAAKLFISRETVRWHLRSLYAKLGIEDRHGAENYRRSLKDMAKGIPAQPEKGSLSSSTSAAG